MAANEEQQRERRRVQWWQIDREEEGKKDHRFSVQLKKRRRMEATEGAEISQIKHDQTIVGLVDRESTRHTHTRIFNVCRSWG